MHRLHQNDLHIQKAAAPSLHFLRIRRHLGPGIELGGLTAELYAAAHEKYIQQVELPRIIDNIVLGLRRRWEREAAPLNIIICENLMDANKVLEGLIKEKLTEEESAVFDQRVGLVEAAIGAAGALCRYLDESEGCKQSLPQAKAALEEIAGLDADSELAVLILDYYRMMLSGDGLKQISDAADRIKGSSLADVI